MNNLSRYKAGETVLITRNMTGLSSVAILDKPIEVEILQIVPGKGKNHPTMVKVKSAVALDRFGEVHKSKEGEYIKPEKTAWLSTKEWWVLARIKKEEK